MNQNIIDNFSKLIQFTNKKIKELQALKSPPTEINALRFKVRNYVKVKKILESYEENITSGNQLSKISGIGKGTIARIDEILNTGTLSELPTSNEIENSQLENQEREKLLTITGVGDRKCDTLLAKNITLKKLQEELSKLDGNIESIPEGNILEELTHHQLVGLKYLDDINLRIPRKEIEKLENKIQKQLKDIDPKLEMIICGSYRRQLPTSGDIDMLVLHPDLKTPEDIAQHPTNFLPVLVDKLSQNKLLVAHLTKDGLTKYMGLCKLTTRSKARRIDIRFIAYQSKAAAMLYFTGSGSFNEIMRSEALKKNYTINEYGIYHCTVTRDKKNKKVKKVDKGAIVPTLEEKDIFDVIGKEYVEPQDRK